MKTIELGGRLYSVAPSFRKREGEEFTVYQMRAKVIAYSEPDESGCWNWMKFKDPEGYGQGRFGKKVMAPHIASYIAFIGEIPKGKELHHECWNKGCCNPLHVKPVTHAENMEIHRSTPEEFRASFMRRVIKDPETGCWIWQGSNNDFSCITVMPSDDGGIIHGTTTTAQRVMWKMEKGHYPKSLVYKKCGNWRCVNPLHLTLNVAFRRTA